MNNQKVDEDVRWAMFFAVRWAVYGAVDEAVDEDVWGAVNVDVDVNLGVGRVVDNAVYWAMGEPKHPALQDFLRSAGADVGARRT